jgi:hypothetical protein
VLDPHPNALGAWLQDVSTRPPTVRGRRGHRPQPYQAQHLLSGRRWPIRAQPQRAEGRIELPTLPAVHARGFRGTSEGARRTIGWRSSSGEPSTPFHNRLFGDRVVAAAPKCHTGTSSPVTSIDESVCAETRAFAAAVRAIITGNLALLRAELDAELAPIQVQSSPPHHASPGMDRIV